MTAVHLYDCDPAAEHGTPVPDTDRRPLHLIAIDALPANCGSCWAHPGGSCAGADGLPLVGLHLARFARARRRGAISGPDMAVVLDAAPDVFTPATVIPAHLAGAAP